MPRGTTELHSGGKMPRIRRTVVPRTPYDRPVPVTRPPAESPNWLGRVVAPATRIISGASKVFSSVLNLDESSSSSSSYSDSDASLDEENIQNEDDACILPDGVNEFNKGATSSGMQTYVLEDQKTVGKMNRKDLIEKLLMEETFSREECDRLISIINSRAMDETLQKVHSSKYGGILGKAVDYSSPELCNKAILEAKKWLENKKVDEGSAASPVDVAKSYMQARPPWLSPTISNEVKTSTGLRLEFLKESTTPTIDSAFSTKKRELRSGGSWNIQEELRRVRTKATEDMLKSISSPKTNLSLFSMEPSSAQGSRFADIIKKDELRKSQFSTPLVEDAPVVHAPEGNQSLKTILALEAVEGVVASDTPVATNGFQTQESLPEVHAENTNGPCSNDDGITNEIIDVPKTSCQLLRETDVEVPINEIDYVDLGSQNSPSINLDEEASQQTSKISISEKMNDTPIKKRVRNPRRGGGRVRGK